jgi:predicted nuclease with RNAse H fold
MRAPLVTAGIDVGGPNKGFHAIALCNRRVVGRLCSPKPAAIAAWCHEIGATLVGVDAPICWSSTGRARPAERALMEKEIWCFSTPSEQVASNHPTRHYDWMLQGAKLYRALDRSFQRFDGTNGRSRPICFETFPHAIACALNGKPTSARNKRQVRRGLLERAAVCCDSLTNIDFIDAALCALAAEYFARRRCVHFGEAAEGCIVVPRVA